MRTPLVLLLATTLAACSAAPPAAAPAPTAAAVSPLVPDQLRPISGAQACAAVPEALRMSLLPGDELSDEIAWSNNVATATTAWGNCDWYSGAPRSMNVTVEAHSTVTQTATDHAKQEFDKSKADAAKLAGPDNWAYTPPVAADHGDAAFSLTGTKTGQSRRSRYVHMVIRQGPWLISIRYRGEERDDCTWQIRDGVGQTDGSCGTLRCGELRIHVNDETRGDRRDLGTLFTNKAESFAKDAPVKYLTGLGDRAFTFGDEVHVLAGGYLIMLSYSGANTGGGIRDDPGYKEPNLDEAALRKSLMRIATVFVSGLPS